MGDFFLNEKAQRDKLSRNVRTPVKNEYLQDEYGQKEEEKQKI